jgi:hypothetical protein
MQAPSLGQRGAQLVGDLSPDLRCAFLIGLQEDLADRGGDDSVLALGHIGQGIAHEVHPAALPGGAHDAGDRALEALVSIGDDQLHAGKTAPNKVLQEVGPEDLRFRGADMQADDLAPALGVDGHGDYCGNADDPPAFAYLEIGGIEPEIRPFAGERAFQKGMDALVNVLAKLGDGGLGDAGHAHGLDEFIDPPGADPADPRFLDHRNQRFLDHLAGLKEARKIGPSTQLGDFQVQRAYPGIQRTVAIAVAPGRALAAAFVATRADQAINVGLHDQLQHVLGDGAQKIRLAALCSQLFDQ